MINEKYIRVIVRQDPSFVAFKTTSVNGKLNLKRLYGRTKDNRWALHAWLLGQPDFCIKDGQIIATNNGGELFIRSLGGRIIRKKSNIFTLEH